MAGSPLLTVMKTAVQKAGRAIARDFGEIENIKGSLIGSEKFLENAKLNAEKVLLAELDKARSGYGYISTIKKQLSKSEEKWIISIIDGETNFFRGIPHWSISLALEDKTGVIAGVVYDVIRNELYYAQKGYGAFVNNRRLKIKDTKEFDGAIVFSSFKAKSCGAPISRLEQGRTLYNSCISSIRSMGAMSLDICYVAAGKGEICFSGDTQPNDIAAASIIAKEAGLFVSNISGGKDFIYEGSIVVAPPSLHGKTVALLKTKA